MIRILIISIILVLAGCGNASTSTDNKTDIHENHESDISLSADNGEEKTEDKEEDAVEKEEEEQRGTVKTESETKDSAVDDSEPIITDKQLGMIPSTISIPSIDVHTNIENVGRIENGQMGVPSTHDNVGWFEPGTKPGDRGSSRYGRTCRQQNWTVCVLSS
jgi:sortase A